MLSPRLQARRPDKLELVQAFASKHAVSLDSVIAVLREVCRVVGLSHAGNDFGVNYMLAEGIDFSIEQIQLKPFLFSPRIGKVGLRDFEIVCCLGIGGFSKVFLVRSKLNGQIYAMKLMVKKFIL
jgi:hypothetical protein